MTGRKEGKNEWKKKDKKWVGGMRKQRNELHTCRQNSYFLASRPF
jgi:ribosomal protein L19E